MTEDDTDILVWSERLADPLRRVAAGTRSNDQVDRGNIIEEIESVGKEKHHAVGSLLLRALLHMPKAEIWTVSRDVAH
ncbi:DUF29 family protein [Rhodopila sp.]|uniref:DUF29 family protein n=1 Tax=Rhodopila sp. TaxID=2480087 RepID=UPI003D0B7D98